jgi:DNA-directed RNA polymerase subunit RPC12/RpoP
MTEYLCDNCGYRFKSDRKAYEIVCPYCGKKSVKEEESISDILDSLEE